MPDHPDESESVRMEANITGFLLGKAENWIQQCFVFETWLKISQARNPVKIQLYFGNIISMAYHVSMHHNTSVSNSRPPILGFWIQNYQW